jgi:hypothetical protein
LAYARAGGVGEEAQHSLLMISPAGREVDLHISLPAIPPAGDRVWDVLAPHIAALDLGIGTVPALDEPARCLMLALHAVGGSVYGHEAEDLRRALSVTESDRWREALDLARAVNAEDLFLAGLARSDASSARVVLSRRAYLYTTRAPSEALGLQRLFEARRRDLPRLLWREIFPTLGFMRHSHPYVRGPIAVTRSYVARWRRIGANLPSAMQVWRKASLATREDSTWRMVGNVAIHADHCRQGTVTSEARGFVGARVAAGGDVGGRTSLDPARCGGNWPLSRLHRHAP